MKRRQFLHAAGMTALGVGASVAAQAQTNQAQTDQAQANPAPTNHVLPPRREPDQPIEWRLASDFPDALDTPRAGLETLARTLADITGGAFTIAVPASGPKAGGRQVPALDMVRDGKADIAFTTTALYADRDPVFGIGGGAPFGPNARQFNAWLLHRGGLGLLNDAYRAHGVRALPAGSTGALTGGWFTHEIAGSGDFAGRRVNAIGLGGPLLARFGAVPQTLFPHDLAPALAGRRIDIAQWTGPHEDELLGLNRNAPFYYYPGWQGGIEFSLLVGLDRWEALPSRHRAALTAAAAQMHDVVQARYDALNAPAIRRLVATGTQLRPTPQAVLAQLHGAAEQLAMEIATRNATFRTIYDSARIFSTEAYLWWQVAEYTYDNFMIRMRAQG